MELRRYRKNWHRRPEKVDSSMFVAFWADQKFVSALDAEGVEWLLAGKDTLKSIEAGDPSLTRIHRGTLARVEAFERLGARNLRRTGLRAYTRDNYCRIAGREFAISRKCKSAVYERFVAHAALQPLPAEVAA
ncbi:hypothetical protein [Pseudomonas sp. TWP3-2]|uniref:hypothetical protein n=1 Tax=Pseudomonas sp. TWP3-2 TaxID=2804574 RepID=UPI003CEAE195